MNSKSSNYIIKKISLILVFSFAFYETEGQQTPLDPVSCWIFTPTVYNPAMVGSKDFSSININTAFQGESNSEILSGSSRISKVRSVYYSAPGTIEYTNFGYGGTLFRDLMDLSKNMGASVSGSYHIPLNNQKLAFLSFGVSVKGTYNLLDTGSNEPKNLLKKTIYPNMDAGIYCFGTNFYAGISATNLLGNPGHSDSLGMYKIPVAREYFFTTGYKILISRSHNIVLEPSVLIYGYDSTINKIAENIKPIIKIYMGNFCVGTYIPGNHNISFFFQYRYPRFNIGAFYELPEKTPYYKKSPIIEFTFGINFYGNKSKYYKQSIW